MALDANRLGDAMMATADAAMASFIGQGSNPANAANYRRSLWRGLAANIIAEFSSNAVIESLSVTMSPNGDPPHTHPAQTTEATGKIS